MRSELFHGSVLVAPLSNLSDYTVLADNVGGSLKDILVSGTSQTLGHGPNAPAASKPEKC